MRDKKKNWGRKALVILLSAVMLLSYSSASTFAVFAEEDTGSNAQVTADSEQAESEASDEAENNQIQEQTEATEEIGVNASDSKASADVPGGVSGSKSDNSKVSEDKGSIPSLKVKYTSPLSDNEIDEDTPLRAGIMKKPLLASESVSKGTINNFLADIFYGVNGNDNVWKAMSSAKGHRFSVRYSFTLDSGGKEEGIYKGSADDSGSSAGVHLVIPATILKDRNGNQADTFEMSIPSREDVLDSIESGESLDGDMSFAWYQDGDDIVIYNFRDIEQGFDGFIEMSYLTSEKTFDYEDMTKSDLIKAEMTANIDGGSNSKAENECGPVVIDTQVELLNMETRIPSKYSSWQKDWGDSSKASDAGIENVSDYTYLSYEVRSRINDNSEMYNLSIGEEITNIVATDVDGNEYKFEDLKDFVKLVGVKFAGSSGLKYDDNSDGVITADSQTANGYRSDYVVVALDKEFFTKMTHWEITTSTNVNVHPYDAKDDSEDTTGTYKRRYVYNKAAFNGGPGGVGSYKRADGYYRYAIENDKQTTYWTSLGMTAGYYSRYDLQEFMDAHSKGETYVLDGLDYTVGTVVQPGKWTMDPDYVAEGKTADTTEEWEKYYRKPVKVEMIDDQFFIYDEQDSSSKHVDKEHKLEAGDYQIDTIALGFNSYDRAYNTDNASFSRKTAISYLKGAEIDGMDELYNEAVVFYARVGSPDADWTEFATYDMNSAKFTDVKGDIASTSGRKIVFKNDTDDHKVYGYKFETYNTHYYTSIGTVPSISLFNTDHVMSFIRTTTGTAEDGTTLDPTESILINNSAITNVYDYKKASDETEPYTNAVSKGKLGSGTTTDADYIRVVQKETALNKNVVATANSPRKREYSISWQIDMSETYTADADGNKNPITQNGGVFYDLLPAGSSVDTDTIAVSNEDGELRSSNYSYELVQDYNGTGRILLIVKVKEPGDNYTLTYDTIHPYESLRDYGNNVYNPIAYETGNANIYFGTTNDNPDKELVGSGSKGSDGKTVYEKMQEAELMTDLPSDATGDKFVYQERQYDIGAITAAASGLSKKVLTDRNGSYAGNGITANNSTYSYRLRYQNSYANETKDLILFDSLENYNGGGDWTGTLQSIDLSLLEEKEIAPKVYISTQALDMSEESSRDLTSSAWKEVDPAKDDLSKAKSVAIDMTKKTDGEDFILAKGDSVAAYLFLKAPKGAERKDGKDGYPEAYNNVYIQTAVYTDTQQGDPKIYNYDYTITRLVIYGDLNMQKVSPEGDPIRNIKFRLYGTSDYGTDVDVYEISDKSGYLTFKDVEKGSYKLVEYEGTPDWLEDHTEHDVVIDGEGNVKVDGDNYTDEIFSVENEPRVHADFSFIKSRAFTEDSDQIVGIEGVKFLLKGESDYGNDVIKDATSDANGTVSFTDVEMGTYILTEIQTNDEYLLNKNEYKVVVNATGDVSISIKGEDGEFAPVDTADGADLVFNTPKYWDIELIKVDKDLPARTLQGAEFTLSGETLDDQLEATSNESGRVEFKHLEAGTYLLKETKAPTAVDGEGKTRPEDAEDDGTYTLNYALDETDYIVTVNEDGTYTIEGLDKNDSGTYVFPDERALSGQITVIKNWVDTDESKRTSPKVHLATNEEYNTIKGVTVTVEWIGDYKAARPDSLGVTLLKNGTAYDGTCKVTAKGNIWTYYYPDFEYTGSDTVVAYEEQPTSKTEGATYTGTAVGESAATPVSGGNATITNTFKLAYDYGYTGAVQEFTAPADGWYQFEAWGAQGGGSASNPIVGTYRVANASNGTGAYTSGKIHLKANDTIYVYVGQGGEQYRNFYNWPDEKDNNYHKQISTSNAWNGGGSGYHDQNDDDGAGGGGGATDFRLTKDITSADGTSWNQTNSLQSRIMVAAGGSGASVGTSASSNNFYGSPGGTIYSTYTATRSSYKRTLSVDQNGTVTTAYTGVPADQSNQTAILGQGLDGYIATSKTSTASVASESTQSNFPWNGMPGGGGGYYGGTTSQVRRGDYSDGIALGGVSYISGFEGCSEFAGWVFTENVMEAGNSDKKADLPVKERAYPTKRNVLAGFNGYARVTWVSEDSSTAPSGTTPSASGGSAEDEYVTDIAYGEKGGWEKVDDNTWKYVVNVFNDNAVYDVWEETIDDYTSDEYGSADKPALQLDGSESKTVYVTNKSESSFGDLEISKEVEGYTTAQKFQMTVTLSGDNIPEGTKVFDVTIGSKTNGVVFTNGVGTISLADGETATIKNVPLGTKYEVEEVANESFAPSYADKSGTISEEGTSVTVTNKYTEPAVGSGNITVAKVVTGAADASDADKAYPFIVMLSDLAPELEYTYTIGSENTTFTSDADGAATLSFELKAGEKAVINDVRVGTGYQVTESAGDYIASYKLTDAGGVNDFSKTAGENTVSNSALTTGEETLDSGENVTVTFTNRLTGTQKLTVAKVVDKNGYDCLDTDEFEITVKFTGLNPGEIISASNGKWKADDMGESEKTITLKDGQSVEFRDVPVGTKYQVTESKNAYVASYKIEGTPDDEVNNVEDFVQDEGANEEYKKALATAEETVNRYENATVTFTNKYEARGTLATADVATKTVTNMQPGLDEDGITFKFKLTAGDNEAGEGVTTPMPLDEEGNAVTETELNFTEAGSAGIDFGDIVFTRPGKYTYTLTEDTTGLSDKWNTSYMGFGENNTITVNVIDNHDGTLTPYVLIQPRIVNDYKTDLVIRKTLDSFLDHDGDVDASFVFIITGKDEDGKVRYKNTAGIQYSAGSDKVKEVTVKNIPLDLEITVEEADSANYTHVGEYKDVPIVFQTEGNLKELFLAEFENKYDDGSIVAPGGGKVNKYVKDEESKTFKYQAGGDSSAGNGAN